MNEKSIVIDIDGTLTDISHRKHFALKRDWYGFHGKLMNDPIREDVAWLIRSNWNNPESERPKIILCTGRPERYREKTNEWLAKNDMKKFIDVLLMRPKSDHKSDTEVKPKMLENYFGSRQKTLDSVLFVIDDRVKVVKAWRDYGLQCWQAREGNY